MEERGSGFICTANVIEIKTPALLRRAGYREFPVNESGLRRAGEISGVVTALRGRTGRRPFLEKFLQCDRDDDGVDDVHGRAVHGSAEVGRREAEERPRAAESHEDPQKPLEFAHDVYPYLSCEGPCKRSPRYWGNSLCEFYNI